MPEMDLNTSFDLNDFDSWGSDEVDEKIAENIDEESYIETNDISRRSMTIFFLIDTSGSMEGTRIGIVNNTMEELLPNLIGIGGTQTNINIAAMKFDNKVEWITKSGPVPVEMYQNWPRQTAYGMTSLGAALTELNKKLSRSAWMNSPSLSYAPVIFLLSDGGPNDEWKGPLATIRKNSWYKHAIKIAIGIQDADMSVLREFTEDPELAVNVADAAKLSEMIKFLTITSSEIGSRSMGLTESDSPLTERDVDGAKKKAMHDAVVDFLGGAEGVDPDSMSFDEGW